MIAAGVADTFGFVDLSFHIKEIIAEFNGDFIRLPHVILIISLIGCVRVIEYSGRQSGRRLRLRGETDCLPEHHIRTG